MPEREAGCDGLGEAAEVTTHALAERLQHPESSARGAVWMPIYRSPGGLMPRSTTGPSLHAQSSTAITETPKICASSFQLTIFRLNFGGKPKPYSSFWPYRRAGVVRYPRWATPEEGPAQVAGWTASQSAPSVATQAGTRESRLEAGSAPRPS